MPMSPYVRGLRAMIGTTVLEVPSVSVLTFDKQDRILLVRHVGDGWRERMMRSLPLERKQNRRCLGMAIGDREAPEIRCARVDRSALHCAKKTLRAPAPTP